MKTLRIAFIALFAAALLAGSAEAQKKTTTKKAPAKKPATTTKVLPPLEVRAAREKVDVQLSNVNSYLNKLGPLAVGLETAIADQKANKLKPETSKSIDDARAKLVTSIRGFREAFMNLETEFRTTTALQKYLPSLQGITDLAEQSEDHAIAGKFVLSKEPLRTAAQRLSDTLAIMPKATI